VTPYYSDDASIATCACGCGGSPAPRRTYITRHNLRSIDRRSPAHRAALSEAARLVWQTKRKRKPLGSRRLDAHGYWLVKVKEGGERWDKEHVLVIEEAIGRRLLPGEQVHHINGVRTDNRLDNLQHCASGSEHMQIEGTFKRLLAPLLEAGHVVYDADIKEYRLG
jgi:hypothetical protein